MEPRGVDERILSDEDLAECDRLTAKEPPRTGGAVRIDPATLPPPMSPDEVEAELERQREQQNILQVLQPSGRLKTYRMKDDGRFRYVPPRLAPAALTATAAPRRQATTSSRRRASTARRASRSRDGPGLGDDSDKPPEHLERLRPLTAVARAYLRAEVDRRRREIVAAQPEVSPEVFHLYDGDRA